MNTSSARPVLFALFFLAICSRSMATTWTGGQVIDPISGAGCSVAKFLSYGGYIYEWESKYDGVYWPYTEFNWVWFCPDSGYTSFGDDFEEVSPPELEKIKAFLERNYEGTAQERTRDHRLWLMENIYRLRDKDPSFWSFFYRAKANLYEALAVETGDIALYEDLAAQSRRAAIPLLEQEVQTLEPGFELIQKLFVLGDYYRRFGDPTLAEQYFRESESVEWTNDEGVSHVGSEYISEMIEERRLFMSD